MSPKPLYTDTMSTLTIWEYQNHYVVREGESPVACFRHLSAALDYMLDNAKGEISPVPSALANPQALAQGEILSESPHGVLLVKWDDGWMSVLKRTAKGAYTELERFGPEDESLALSTYLGACLEAEMANTAH